MTKASMIGASLLALPLIILSAFFRESRILYVIGTVELGLIALVINVFVGLYSRRNWNSNPYGRALMYTMLSLAAVSYLSVITAFLGPEWEWRYFVRIVLFSVILVTHAHMLQLLITIKRTVREEELHE